ncbi:MAG TPA: hypothetical protein VJS45_11305 [Acidimicrobiia bacterium]|nr:hypothetical protein [Acidimicrobiia bacterium]
MDVTPDDPTVAAGATAADRRRLAREMADEFLGRGAAIARASIKPLGFFGRLALIAGLVIWLAGPSPLWENRPHIVSSLICLAFFALPGLRLLRHRTRMQEVLENLPTLLDDLTRAMSTVTEAGGLASKWRQSGESAKPGVVGTGKRTINFYRNDLAPFRQGPGAVIEHVNDALAAFAGPALVLSGIAVLLGLAFVVLCPVAVVIRLVLLG